MFSPQCPFLFFFPRILSPSQCRFTFQQNLYPHGAERKGHFSSTCWRLPISTMSPQKDVYQNDGNLECALLGSLVNARIACHGWIISFDICTFQDLAFYYCQMGCRWFPRRSHSLPLVSFLIRILHEAFISSCCSQESLALSLWLNFHINRHSLLKGQALRLLQN